MQLYVSSNLNAKNINLNSTNQSIEGTNINGNAINPQEQRIENTTSFGGGISVNPFTGQVGISANFNDFSISGGFNLDTGYQGGLSNNASFGNIINQLPFGNNLLPVNQNGSSGFLSLGYKDFKIGGSAGSGIGSLGNSIGGFLGYGNYGTIGISHSTTNGTSTHNVWSPNFSVYGGLLGVVLVFKRGIMLVEESMFMESMFSTTLMNLLITLVFPRELKSGLEGEAITPQPP